MRGGGSCLRARVDLTALADELGDNRVTLYRWVGSRDRLLVETRLQRWLAEEGEHAMRLLTRRQTGFQPRLADRRGMIPPIGVPPIR